MKSLLAVLLIALMVFTPTAGAITIPTLDCMSDKDQISYVDQLAQSVEDATTGELHTRVHRFFMPTQPGEGISGMEQFEMNLNMARIADIEAVAKNPKVRRLEVEDVLYETLERAGIILPHHFHPSAVHFRPSGPNVRQPLNLAQAQKGLKDTETRISLAGLEQHDFRPGSHTALTTDSQKGIALFAALIALAAASSGSTDSSTGSPDNHEADPWWVKSGYNSYHDAARAACVGAHNGNASGC